MLTIFLYWILYIINNDNKTKTKCTHLSYMRSSMNRIIVPKHQQTVYICVLIQNNG